MSRQGNDTDSDAAWPRFGTAALGVALFMLAACGSAKTFVTEGRYTAPAGRFALVVRATGIVPAGADVADSTRGVARLCAAGAGAHDIEFFFSIPGDIRYVVTGTGVSGQWTQLPREDDLAQVIRGAGIADVTAAEVNEVRRVFGGALSGPKGLVMEGQTTVFPGVKSAYEYGVSAAAQQDALRPVADCR